MLGEATGEIGMREQACSAAPSSAFPSIGESVAMVEWSENGVAQAEAMERDLPMKSGATNVSRRTWSRSYFGL